MPQKVVFISILWLILQGVIQAQPIINNCATQKVALYNDGAFDSEYGIRRLYKAYNVATNSEAFPGGFMDPEKDKEYYEKRKTVLVDPILNEITISTKRIADANDLQIYEASRWDESRFILAYNKKFDITGRLIEYFNRPREAMVKLPKIKVEPSRIGKIDTSAFFDPNHGIRGWALTDPSKIGKFCYSTKKCEEVGKYAEEYAIKYGFSIIFDSAQNLPADIQAIACEDLTKDFIAGFNEYLNKKELPR